MPIDPAAAKQILESVLTLAGGTIASGIIAGIIQLAKGIPNVGPVLDAGREYVLALILSAALIAYAVIATAQPADLVALFGYFLAWLGLAKLAAGVYDVAQAAAAKIAGPPAP